MHRYSKPGGAGAALVLLALALVGPLAAPAAGQASGQADSAPEGVEILLPRGGIPAVFEPHFVGAAEAQMPDDAWILGVFMNGEARAYDLNLLNHHEIVNDEIGGTPIAAVW
jgi:hypothetical protein